MKKTLAALSFGAFMLLAAPVLINTAEASPTTVTCEKDCKKACCKKDDKKACKKESKKSCDKAKDKKCCASKAKKEDKK